LGRLLTRQAKVLSANIRAMRKGSKLSQADLAAKARIDIRYLGGIERGQENPSLRVLVDIARALKVEPFLLMMDLKNDL